MSTLFAFTPQQEQMLVDLAKVHPDRWRVEVLETLEQKITKGKLTALLRKIKEQRATLQGMQAVLPVRSQVSDYISRTSWHGGIEHTVAVVDVKGDTRHLEVPGSDIQETILARDDTLERLPAIADELIREV